MTAAAAVVDVGAVDFIIVVVVEFMVEAGVI